MTDDDLAFAKERGTHNHVTRDVKPVGKCPACDCYWGITYRPTHRTADNDNEGMGSR